MTSFEQEPVRPSEDRRDRVPEKGAEPAHRPILRLLAYLSITTFCAVMAAGAATSSPSMGPVFFSPGILRLAMVLSGVLAPLFAYGALMRVREASMLRAVLHGVRAGLAYGATLGLAIATGLLWERWSTVTASYPSRTAYALAAAGLFLAALTGGFFGSVAGGLFNAIGRAAVFPERRNGKGPAGGPARGTRP